MKSGSSLIEILLYVAIATIVLIIVGESVSAVFISQQKIKTEKEVIGNLTLALGKIRESIKEASAITGDYPANTLNLTINGATTTYSLSNGFLQKKIDSADAVNITTDKVTITPWSGEHIFTQVSTQTMQIKLEATSTVDSQTHHQIETTVGLRENW